MRFSSLFRCFLLGELVFGVLATLINRNGESLLSISLAGTTSAITAPNIPTSELNGLYALYNATGGDNWTWPQPVFNVTGPLPWESGVPWTFSAHANPCTENWYGIACTDTLSQHIKSIVLPAQNMSGTLPNELGDFHALHKLEFRHNPRLNGTIPDVFGNLTVLQGFDMSHNSLNGTLPPSLLAAASTLESLVVYNNLLSGPFPTFLCSLSQLLELNLANNSLTGTIPDCIGQLTNIHGLTVGVNLFTGPIPQTIGDMTNLHEISFESNAVTGQIPESIGNLVYLKYLAMFISSMSGQIPNSICKLQSLEGLFAYNSHFSGTLPYCLSNMSRLQTVDLNDNYFTGPFPAGILTTGRIEDFALRHSALDDVLPLVWSTFLQTFEMGGNRLHGRVPDALFMLPNLHVMELFGNDLTGPLPSSMRGSTSLTTLDLGQNHFTGPIPADIGNCTDMAFILLNDNLMDGSLPHSLSQLPKLAELNVESNLFHGSLLDAIDSSRHTALTTILLNDNQFTGQIPDDLFLLPALTVFAAVGNCFYSKLTEVMCDSETLVTLALDGLRSGKTCRAELLHGLTNAYAVEHALVQPVPSCLFEMKSLTTLHLSGNGLSGQLPGNITISGSLTQLSLSHNDLTGVIPTNFQSKPWTTLDLSYNRLTGTLIESFARDDKFGNLTAAYADLSLENNRISGQIPRILLEAKKISILGSNIFDCNDRRTNLPHNDKGRQNYHCASKSFDLPYYIWLALLVVCMCIGALVAWSRGVTAAGVHLLEVQQRVLKAVRNVHSADLKQQVRSLLAVITLYENVCRLAVVCVGYMLVVLVPFYFAAAGAYGTFYHQYAWQVSAALLSGRVASAVVMTLLLILQCALLYIAYILVQRSRRDSALRSENRSSRPNSTTSLLANATVLLSWFERCSVYALFMTLSISVVVGVNIAYVVVVLNERNNIVVLVQILLAFFKLFWNNFCSKNLMRWAGNQISKSAEVEATESVYGREFHFVQLLVSLINNIGIPCIVVAVVSPNCLYSVFVAAPVVKASYEYQSCETNGLVGGRCLHYDTGIGYTSYNPPFVYNYQCSSSIVTYYAPAFVFLCITATFLTPLSQFIAWRAARDERLPVVIRTALDYCIPKIMKPPDTAALPVLSSRTPYFDASRAAILLFSYFGMLMTFGAVFPPLAVALAVTIFSTTFFIRLKIGNFLGSAIELKAGHFVKVLNCECERLARMAVLGPSVWLIVTFSCWFYTLFLFDTLGDAVGFKGAYWVLIVMPLMPVCLYLLYYTVVLCVERYTNSTDEPSLSEATLSPIGRQSSTNVELSELYSGVSESTV